MKHPFTIYRTIRIDGEFDTAKRSEAESVIEEAIQKVIADAMAHTHIIVDGVQVTDVIDCGEAV